MKLEHSGNVRVEVHYYFHNDQPTTDALTRIEAKLDAITKREGQMGVQLDNLTTQVQRESDAEQAVITLLEGLAQQVSSLAPTQQAIDDLASQIGAQADALAAAVVANTPAGTGGGGAPTPPTGGVATGGGGNVGAPTGPTPPDTGSAGGATDTGAGTGDQGTTEPTP